MSLKTNACLERELANKTFERSWEQTKVATHTWNLKVYVQCTFMFAFGLNAQMICPWPWPKFTACIPWKPLRQFDEPDQNLCDTWAKFTCFHTWFKQAGSEENVWQASRYRHMINSPRDTQPRLNKQRLHNIHRRLAIQNASGQAFSVPSSLCSQLNATLQTYKHNDS